MDNQLILFYITIPDEKVGRQIAETLLDEKLIACANIFPPHRSVYQWQGKLESEQEQVMILKTRKGLTKSVEDRLKDLHPYECPCLIQIASHHVNTEFLTWVADQTPV